jgi:DNA-binding response OmpR family regulator
MIDKAEAAGPLVLVVDDEANVRSVIGRVLEKNGFRVLLASDGQEGIRQLELHPDELKLVVLDWHLPGDPGERTFDELIARKPSLRIVLVTGDHAAELGPIARESLACMLLKPFTTDELILTVNAVLYA